MTASILWSKHILHVSSSSAAPSFRQASVNICTVHPMLCSEASCSASEKHTARRGVRPKRTDDDGQCALGASGEQGRDRPQQTRVTHQAHQLFHQLLPVILSSARFCARVSSSLGETCPPATTPERKSSYRLAALPAPGGPCRGATGGSAVTVAARDDGDGGKGGDDADDADDAADTAPEQ